MSCPWNPDGTECANSATTSLSRADQALPVRSPATTELNPSPSPTEHLGAKTEHFRPETEHIGRKSGHIRPKSGHIGRQTGHIHGQSGHIGGQIEHLSTQTSASTPRGDVPADSLAHRLLSRSPALPLVSRSVYTQSIATSRPSPEFRMPTLGVHRHSGSVHLALARRAHPVTPTPPHSPVPLRTPPPISRIRQITPENPPKLSLAGPPPPGAGQRETVPPIIPTA